MEGSAPVGFDSDAMWQPCAVAAAPQSVDFRACAGEPLTARYRWGREGAGIT